MSKISAILFFFSIIIVPPMTYGSNSRLPQKSISDDDVSDFKNHIESKKPYVDKSMFIDEAIHGNTNSTLITRPRGFGKSINLSMMKYFLDLNETSEHLFRDLLISEETELCESHQNKYPVIYLSFKYVVRGTYEKTVDAFKSEISNLYKKHDYLKKGLNSEEKGKFEKVVSESADEMETARAISMLIGFLHGHYGKTVYLLIDDYDVPARNAYFNGFYTEIVSFMNSVICDSVENTRGLQYALVFGTVAISEMGDGAFDEIVTIMDDALSPHRFSQYFGFSQQDVVKLTEGWGVVLRDLETYYGGFFLGNATKYNPGSVLLFKTKNGANRFWLETTNKEPYKDLLLNNGVIPAVKADMLLRGIEIVHGFSEKTLVLSSIQYSENSFWYFLTQLGYLTISGRRKVNDYYFDFTLNTHYEYSLRIPNKEARRTFETVIQSYTQKYDVLSYSDFVNSFRTKNYTNIRRCLESYMKNCGSFTTGRTLEELGDFLRGLLKGLEREYGPMVAKRLAQTDILTIEMGPSNLTSDKLVFTLEELDADINKIKEICLKLCLFVRGKNKNFILKSCDVQYKIKVRINKLPLHHRLKDN